MATILVVDDYPPGREYLLTLLRFAGHRLLESATGAHALALAQAEHPDLIITDLIMPEMTGYEFAHRVRADPVLGATHIVFYTGSEIVGEVERLAAACGVRHILTKPAEPEQVLAVVAQALGDQPPSAPPPPSEDFHREHLLLLTNTLTSQVERLEAEIARRNEAEGQVRLQSAALDAAANAVMITDQTGAIVWVNPAFTRLTGYTLAEVRGHNARLLKSGTQDAAYYQQMWTTILSGGGWQGEVTNQRKDGTLYIQDQTITPLLDDHGQVTHFIAIQQDITERKRTEARLRSQAQVIESVADAVISMDTHSIIRTWNRSAEAMLGYAAADAIGRPAQELLPQVLVDAAAAAAAQPVTAARSPDQEASVQGKDHSVITILVSASALRDTAGQFEGCVIVLHDITARRQRERELEAVGQMSAALRTATTSAEMWPVVVDQVMVLFEATSAAIVLRDAMEGDLVVAEARGQWASRSGERMPAGRGVSGNIVATGVAYVSADARADPRFLRPELLTAGSAVAGVPLHARNETLGALWGVRAQEFSLADLRVLTAIADIVANAIQRATLFEATEEGLRRLTALRTIDQAITGSLDLHLILNIVLDQATHLLRSDAAAVLLLEPNSQTLTYAVGAGFHGRRLSGLRRRLGEGLAGRAALDRRTLSVYDIPTSPGALSDQASLGLVDYRSCHATPLIAKGVVVGVLELWQRDDRRRDAGWLEFLEALAGQAAIAVDGARLFDELQQSNAHLLVAYDATIEGWSRALELRDHETEGHTMRVTEMTLTLARAVGVPETDLVHIRRGALLHDIGKMGVPDTILRKPGPLDDNEWVIMRRHPMLAYEMLLPIAYLRPALDIPYCHHEKWDGTGYPRGLKGPQIPLAARVFAVVDVWDALRTDRPYRAAWAEVDVIAYIRAHTGTHFDPLVAEAFLQVLAVQ